MLESALPLLDSLDLKFVVLGISTQNYTYIGRVEDSKLEITGAIGMHIYLISIWQV
jgi:hypothetical protein